MHPTHLSKQHAIYEADPRTDAIALARFAAHTFPDACPDWMPRHEIDSFIASHLSAEQFERWLADPHAHVFVAEAKSESGHDAEIVGYATSLHCIYDDGPAAWATQPSAFLSKLYVHEAHRGSGLAAQLLETAKQAAVADNCAGIWLGVAPENERAKSFYMKSGMHEAGGRPFTVGSRTQIDTLYAIAFK